MAVTFATITKAASGPSARRRFEFYPQTDGNTVTIAAEDYEHTGPYEAVMGISGAFTVQLPTGTDQGGADLLWKIVETPIDRIDGRVGGPLAKRTIGFVTITASIDYDDLIADLVGPTVVSPTLTTTVTALVEDAETAATTATTKATEAEGFADAALDSAANADSSADLAAVSETAAETAASTATTQAATATTKAGEAATSATTAATHLADVEDLVGAAEAVAVSNDTIIAGRVNDPASATAGALSATIAARTHVIDTDYASLTAALAETPEYGILEIRDAHTLVLPFVVDVEGVEVRFARGGSIDQTGAGADGIRVTANDVTIGGIPRITGTGSGTAGSSNGVHVVGTVGAYNTGFRYSGDRRRGGLTGWDKHGLLMEFASDWDVQDLRVDDVAYGGFIGLSVENGNYRRVTVTNVTQPAGFVNSYGVGFSRDSSLSLANAPHSQNIVGDDVWIEGVPLWEGYDVHGTINVTLRNFTILNCYKGAVLTTSKNEANVETWAPKNAVLEHGYVDAQVSDGSRANGVLCGGVTTDKITGRIANVTVVDHGKDVAAWSSDLGSFYFTECDSVQVSNIKSVRGACAAVQMVDGCSNLTINGLTAEDTWTNLFGATGTVYSVGVNNKATVGTVRIVRGSKAATVVNQRGLWISGDYNSEIIDAGGSNWNACTLPYVGTAGRVRVTIGQLLGAVANALPTIGTWDRGAQVLYSTPSAGGSPGWVCTTAGGNGAAWVATTARAKGTWIKSTSGGRVFEASVAGTSAATEPAGFAAAAVGDTVTDGTITYVCRATTQAVFKAMPAIAA